MPNTPEQWAALTASAQRINTIPSERLLEDSARNQGLRLSLAGCHFDFTRQRVDRQILDELHGLAQSVDLSAKRDAMFAGNKINTSENREVLHSALRDGAPNAPDRYRQDVAHTKKLLFKAADDIRSGAWRGFTNKAIKDVVHIGIGGSHLGPELVVNALAHLPGSENAPNIHFVANIDANDINKALLGLNPETTLFIVVSKSFSTLETQVNAATARSWFLERTCNPRAIGQHFIGVTTNLEAAAQFGLEARNIFPLWDWVGGRFSLWSAVGLPILLQIGTTAFDQLLAGARQADEHFVSAPAEQNIPLLSALMATWNTTALNCDSLVVLSYDQRLTLLPDFLQQLEMESNGKSVDLSGKRLDYRTMQILWGGCGTNGQHAYHQLLHQGTSRFAADFIMVASDALEHKVHHQWLLANGIAQGQAMAQGHQPTNPNEQHKHVTGQHPSTSIVLDELGPIQLGCLLAIYEHKVFCQGVLWNINSFDQWGVELGKNLALPIFDQLQGDDASNQDPATRHLIDHYRAINQS